MRFDIITIFPEIFGSVFSGGILSKALEKTDIHCRREDQAERGNAGISSFTAGKKARFQVHRGAGPEEADHPHLRPL